MVEEIILTRKKPDGSFTAEIWAERMKKIGRDKDGKRL